MIISSKSIPNVLKVYGDQNQVNKKNNASNAPRTQGKDEFILSSSAQEFSQVFKTAKGMSDVRPEKVQEFSAKIDAGTYEVNSAGIADKMFGSYID